MRIKIVVFCSTLASSGCAILSGDPFQLESSTIGTPLERAFAVDDDVSPLRGISVDAKQRFVWSPRIPVKIPVPAKDYETTGNIVTGLERRSIICAEPSPDALTAITNTIDTELQGSTVLTSGQSVDAAARLSGSLSETAKALGERTQVTQLLRDALYRACEAYANGAIDDFGYSLILGQIDLFMLQLLSVDVLGKTQNRKAFAKAKAEFEAAQAAVEKLDGELREAESQVSNLEQQKLDLADQKAKLESAKNTVITLTAEKTRLTARQGELRAAINNASKSGVDAADKRALAVQRARELRETEDKVDRLERDAQTSEAALDRAQADLDAKDRQIHEQRILKTRPGSDDEAIDALIVQLEAERNLLMAERDQARTAHDAKTAALNAAESELTNARSDAEKAESDARAAEAGGEFRDAGLARDRDELRRTDERLAKLDSDEIPAANARVAQLEGQSAPGAVDENVLKAARDKVSELRGTRIVAEAKLKMAQGALGEAEGGIGGGVSEAKVLDNLINRAFDASEDGSVGRVTKAACLQWFARHPQHQIKVEVDTEGNIRPVPNAATMPAIGFYCHGMLRLTLQSEKKKIEAEQAEATRASAEAALWQAELGVYQ